MITGIEENPKTSNKIRMKLQLANEWKTCKPPPLIVYKNGAEIGNKPEEKQNLLKVEIKTQSRE